MLAINKIHLGDCLEVMKTIPDGSVDMVLCDLPYGQTARNDWDCVIPYGPLWEQYERVVKPNGAIVLFANWMFTAGLMMSNPKLWRYNLVWDKVLPSGFLNAKKMPLRSHEDVCVFYRKPPAYNPQMTDGKACHSTGAAQWAKSDEMERRTNYGRYVVKNTEGNLKYPKSVLAFPKPHPSTTDHHTQKSVELCEWLLLTYTDAGAVVLDNCAGSGTTGVAALRTGRNFILIERDERFFGIANKRLEREKEALTEPTTTEPWNP